MIELDKNNFNSAISEGIVLVDFWSESCERCVGLMPEIVRLEASFCGKVTFCSLNIQGNRRLAIAQKVMGLPSVVIWRDGKRIIHLSGEALDGQQIRQALEDVLHNMA